MALVVVRDRARSRGIDGETPASRRLPGEAGAGEDHRVQDVPGQQGATGEQARLVVEPVDSEPRRSKRDHAGRYRRQLMRFTG